MRLIMLTAFTMIAFASNSVLTRMAIEPGLIDPIAFAIVRVASGAAFLCALCYRKGTPLSWSSPRRWVGAISLSVYMVGFSIAYLFLDAGLGALVLFGVVQISMFSFATATGSKPTGLQLLGACIAFCGLVVALWPGEKVEISMLGAFAMALAGLGWAAYTISGQKAQNPLAETAANFALSLPVLLCTTVFFIDQFTAIGIALAILCGAITSGLGYALWYSVLPGLQGSVAAVVQLSVPIIAIFAGAVLLGEPITVTILSATALVLLGIGMAVIKRSSPVGRS